MEDAGGSDIRLREGMIDGWMSLAKEHYTGKRLCGGWIGQSFEVIQGVI